MFDVDEFVRELQQGNPRFNRIRTSSFLPIVDRIRQNGLQAELPFVMQFLRQTSERKRTKYRLAIADLMQASMALERQLQPRKSIIDDSYRPANFRWLPGCRVAGMSRFCDNEFPLASMWWLYNNGVRHVISIERNGYRLTRLCVAQVGLSMTWSAEFLPDYATPSVEQLRRFCETVWVNGLKGAVAVHCWGGTGRTGCFLAAYVIYLGRIYDKKMSSEEAINFVRSKYRDKAIETDEQRKVIKDFVDQFDALCCS
jgi:hypothetical protein